MAAGGRYDKTAVGVAALDTIELRFAAPPPVVAALAGTGSFGSAAAALSAVSPRPKLENSAVMTDPARRDMVEGRRVGS